MGMSEKLREIADTLDRVLGDTDPHIEPDWTDEEIQREYPLFWSCRELYKMSNHPTHETVQQWEDRTGDTYPDDGPVWSILHNDMKSTKTWKLYEYKKARNNFNVSKSIVATHHGKPGNS